MTPLFTCAPVPFDQIRDEVRAQLASLPSRIDAFFESHILESNHYRIGVDGAPAGFASIHGGGLITQFWIAPRFRQHGRAIFAGVRQLEEARSAFVPTCDEFFLAHALDDYRVLAKQAYFFAARDDAPQVDERFRLRQATLDDAAFIREQSGDFLEPVEERIGRDELFVTLLDGEPVGFGIREVSVLYDRAASVGMFTFADQRQRGVGAATIGLLIADCRTRDLAPIAGCWYHNHNSKKTLERAGMASSTRLLRIEF